MLIQDNRKIIMSTRTENNLEKYENLIKRFVELKAEAKSSNSAELECKISLQKLRIAREFAEIDESILNISLKQDPSNSQFFSEILFLETKRLRFKEEASKCIQTRTRPKIST